MTFIGGVREASVLFYNKAFISRVLSFTLRTCYERINYQIKKHLPHTRSSRRRHSQRNVSSTHAAGVFGTLKTGGPFVLCFSVQLRIYPVFSQAQGDGSTFYLSVTCVLVSDS